MIHRLASSDCRSENDYEIWRFLEMEVPPDHPKLENFMIETHGFGDQNCLKTIVPQLVALFGDQHLHIQD